MSKPFWKNKIIGHDNVAPDQLMAHPQNWRMHPRFQQEALRGVINDIGYIKSVTVNQRTGRVVDGHLRVTLALQDNIKAIPVEYVDLTEAEETEALLTLDPLSALAGGDRANLESLLAQVSTDDAAVMELLSKTAAEARLDWGKAEQLDAEPQAASGLREVWQTETGQLWQLGEHRLLIGDCTARDNVERLVDGKIDLLFTSPPYNQGGEHRNGDLASGRNGKLALYENYEDNLSEKEYSNLLLSFLECAAPLMAARHSVVVNVSYNAQSRDLYGKVIFSDRNPFTVRETIVWDKKGALNFPNSGIYSRRCELIFVMSSSEKYLFSEWTGTRWNYYDIPNVRQLKEHRAAFPLALAERVLSDFSIPGSAVYDPFAGTGTTIMAAHNLGRRCYAMEIIPDYGAVILQRYQDATGIAPAPVN
jgi:DNA modification methylase